MGWQKMDTAPRNGTEFQAWVRITLSAGLGYWEPRARFDPQYGTFQTWEADGDGEEGWHYASFREPYRWMPQPDPPHA